MPTGKSKRGRPRKEGGSERTKEKRRIWREASAKYWGKNRKKILRKMKVRK